MTDPSASSSPADPEFQTHEVMMGYLAEGDWPTGIDYPSFQAGYLQGRPANNFVYTDLQLSTGNVLGMVLNPKHPMRIDGTCSAAWWGDAAIVNGTFQIFVNASPNPYFDNLFYYWQMDGGELQVRIDASGMIRQRGPVTVIATGTLSDELERQVEGLVQGG